jgi:hypothetical protein
LGTSKIKSYVQKNSCRSWRRDCPQPVARGGKTQVNKVGEEALNKGLGKIDMKIEDKDQLYAATLAGDIVSNGLYYAATATNNFSLLSGAAAGVGSVYLPSQMGLDDNPVAETTQKKLMTIGY